MHWLVSRSNEYCSFGSTAKPFLCGAVRSCPVSNGFADFRDTSFSSISGLPGIPDDAFEVEHTPRVFSGERRKMPANAELRACGYKSQAAFLGDLCGTNSAPTVDESPVARIRRMISLVRLKRACLHICELVFFRLEIGIVAFFPCFCASELNFFLTQNCPESFNTDRRKDLFFDKVFTKFFQRPPFKRTIQKVRRALRSLGNKCLVIFCKFNWSARTRLGIQCFKSTFIKIFDDGSDMVLGIMDKFCDSRNFIALVRSEDNLSSANLDSTFATAKYSLNFLAFGGTEVSGIQTHKKSLSLFENMELFLRVILYNTRLCMAQVLNLKKVKIIFLKRH